MILFQLKIVTQTAFSNKIFSSSSLFGLYLRNYTDRIIIYRKGSQQFYMKKSSEKADLFSSGIEKEKWLLKYYSVLSLECLSFNTGIKHSFNLYFLKELSEIIKVTPKKLACQK